MDDTTVQRSYAFICIPNNEECMHNVNREKLYAVHEHLQLAIAASNCATQSEHIANLKNVVDTLQMLDSTGRIQPDSMLE